MFEDGLPFLLTHHDELLSVDLHVEFETEYKFSFLALKGGPLF